MAIQPGSLDYLYYNGILDHIPYEAYEGVVPAQPTLPINGSDYITSARKGMLYDNYHNGNDTYVNSFGDFKQLNMPAQNNGQYENNEEKNSFFKKGNSFKETVLNSTSNWKGLLALGIIIATPIMFIKCRKKAPKHAFASNSFWSKINPFKKRFK